MQSLQRQQLLRKHGKMRWVFYGLPLIALALTLIGFQVKLTTTRAATSVTENTSELVQLSHDPYTNGSPISGENVYHQTGYEPAAYAFDSTIVSTFQVGRFDGGGSTNLGWATSTDAGRHWHTGLLSGITTYAGGTHARVSNASVAYDPKHHVWLIESLVIDNTTIGGNPAITSSGVVVSRSLDGGLTWSAPVVVSMAPSGDVNGYDKPWMSCDTSAHSSFYGNCYILWNDTPAQDLSTSTDGGATWGEVKHSAQPFNGIPGQLIVQPNGTVVVVTTNDSQAPLAEPLVAFTSTDGGQSWGAAVTVTTQFSLLPSLTEDANGTLYALWAGPPPGGNSNGNAVFLVSSTDGVHWTAPQTVIAPGGATIYYDHVALAADPQTRGPHTHLGLTYYTTDDAAPPATMQPFFLSSTDAGQHWSTAQALSDPISTNWLVPKGQSVGDYISTVFSHEQAFPFFVIGTERGSNDPYHQEVYTLKEGIRC